SLDVLSVFDAIDALIIACDSSGEIVFVNQYTLDTLGFPVSRLTGNGWWELNKRNSRDLGNLKTSAGLMAEGKIPLYDQEVFENSIKTAGNTNVWIQW